MSSGEQGTDEALGVGCAAIVDRVVLKDQRHMLLKDQAGEVSLLDTTTGVVVKEFGMVDFKAKEAELFQPISVPKWFDHDNRLGMITLTLENPRCFSAEVYAKDLGVEAPEDRRINYGDTMLRSLFATWAFHKNPDFLEQSSEVTDLWGKSWVDADGKVVENFRFWERPQPVGE